MEFLVMLLVSYKLTQSVFMFCTRERGGYCGGSAPVSGGGVGRWFCRLFRLLRRSEELGKHQRRRARRRLHGRHGRSAAKSRAVDLPAALLGDARLPSGGGNRGGGGRGAFRHRRQQDRKSTRLNSSH